MRYAASVPRPPVLLLILLTIVTAASLAHALPSREQRAGAEAPANGVVEAGEEAAGNGPDDDAVEQQEPPLPPPPSEVLIGDMTQQNELSTYHYRFWNVTDLAGCRRAAEQLNNETRRARSHSHREEHHQSCTPTYSCDFDRLRFPHWLVFTSCSLAPCDPAARPGARCVAHEEFIVMLHYIERDRSGSTSTATRSRPSVAAKNSAVEAVAAAGGAAEKHTAQEKGEWRLWFVDVPSECRCVQ